jgi:hypothetical protein
MKRLTAFLAALCLALALSAPVFADGTVELPGKAASNDEQVDGTVELPGLAFMLLLIF